MSLLSRISVTCAFAWAVAQPFFAYADTGRIAFLNDEGEAIRARMDLIAEAKHEILLSTHIFQEDIIGTRALALLADARKRGVRVSIVVDGLGDKLSTAMKQVLLDHGVEFYRFRPKSLRHLSKINKRLHDKLFIVDGEKMIIGDRNMKDAAFALSDHSFVGKEIYVEGQTVHKPAKYYREMLNDPAIVEVTRRPVDLTKWLEKGFKLQSEVHAPFPKPLPPPMKWKEGIVEVAETEFWHDSVRLKGKAPGIAQDLLAMLDRAKAKIVLKNPYIVLTQEFKDALRRASNRGVAIHVISNAPRANDVKIVGAAWEKSRKFLTEIGATVWEHLGPGKPTLMQKIRRGKLPRNETSVHAKVFVVDDEVFVGSFNLDPRSQNLNLETGQWAKKRELAEELIQSFRDDLIELPYVKTVEQGMVIALPHGARCIDHMLASILKPML